MKNRAAETDGKPKGEGDRTSPQTSKTTRSGKADAVAVLPGPAQRSTKALYKIIDTNWINYSLLQPITHRYGVDLFITLLD